MPTITTIDRTVNGPSTAEPSRRRFLASACALRPPRGYHLMAMAESRARVENKEVQSWMHDAPRGIVSARVARCWSRCWYGWASEELNLGPHAYQACALTT